MKCWIVYESQYSYSDYWQKPIAVFNDENLAKAEKAVRNSQLKEWQNKICDYMMKHPDYENKELDEYAEKVTGGRFTYAFEVNEMNDYFIEECDLFLKD